MKNITGLGGVFIKAKDPKALAARYEEVLGVGFNNNTYADMPFTDESGQITPRSNVLSFFESDAEYFKPSGKQEMLNLRVHDLFSLLDQLRNNNIANVGDPVDEEYGKFGWIMDAEGNKIELWQPPDK